MTEPILRPSDFQSETWRRLMAIWEARLADLRERNDNPQSEADTALLRGRIEEVRFNLAQPKYLERLADREQSIELGDISALF